MAANDINPVELDFLLRFPAVPNVTSPVDFMNNNSWGGIKVRLKKKISRITVVKQMNVQSCLLLWPPLISGH